MDRPQHHRATGLSHHPWNEQEDTFLAFMVAVGLTVEGIRLKLKELFNIDLRDNQITGRIADVKKRAPFIATVSLHKPSSALHLPSSLPSSLPSLRPSKP